MKHSQADVVGLMRVGLLKMVVPIVTGLLLVNGISRPLFAGEQATTKTPSTFPAFTVQAIRPGDAGDMPASISLVSAGEPNGGEPNDGLAMNGRSYDAAAIRAPGLTVVCFLGTECPLAKLYTVRLMQLKKTLAQQQVRFVGLFPNVQDSQSDLRAFSVAHKIDFPIGKDDDQRIANSVGVQRTPAVFLVRNTDLQILYRGRIDDQYSPGISRAAPTRRDLQIAIEQNRSGQPVAVAVTEPEGCLIGRNHLAKGNRKPEPGSMPDSGPTVTWANQVSRVLRKNCLECHRAGEIGPFSMEEYEDVVGWADMMMETIGQKRMPPWHADPDVGEFINQRTMSQSDIDTLQRWIDQGMPFGDRNQLPRTATGNGGWNLPKSPDLVIPMASTAFSVPADGVVEYQYFVVDPEFETDRWVVAAEVRPGNRSVVHHSIVFIRPPDGTTPAGVGWLGAYVPGQRPLNFNPHRARFVPAGSRLVFQQHYTTTGKPEEDVTSVGLVFADEEEIDTELITLMAINQNFEIKPHEKSHRVTARISNFGKNRKLISVSPHMHFRGKSFKAWLELSSDTNPEAKESGAELLIHVPRYDFNWQHVYQFSDQRSLDDVSAVRVEVEFDNSRSNPFNPDPDAWVMWGDQTFEEMAVAFFDVEHPRTTHSSRTAATAEESQAILPRLSKREMSKREIFKLETVASLTPAQRKRLDQFVKDYFARFDSDDNGSIAEDELPRIKRYEVNQFDKNNDLQLTPSELSDAVWQRFKATGS